MTIDEFSASIRCGEDSSGSLRALVSARRKKFTAGRGSKLFTTCAGV
jgi:hypothetical protein